MLIIAVQTLEGLLLGNTEAAKNLILFEFEKSLRIAFAGENGMRIYGYIEAG